MAFLDLSMPGMGGVELAHPLRHEFSLVELVLVALTGLRKDSATDQGAAIDQHVLKPVSPESLVTLLNEVSAASREGDSAPATQERAPRTSAESTL
jgi:CheY-like chemotaxis protein